MGTLRKRWSKKDLKELSFIRNGTLFVGICFSGVIAALFWLGHVKEGLTVLALLLGLAFTLFANILLELKYRH